MSPVKGRLSPATGLVPEQADPGYADDITPIEASVTDPGLPERVAESGGFSNEPDTDNRAESGHCSYSLARPLALHPRDFPQA